MRTKRKVSDLNLFDTMNAVHQCGMKMSDMFEALETELVKVDNFVHKNIARVQRLNVPKAVFAVVAVVMLVLMKAFVTMGMVKFCLVLLMGATGNEKFVQHNPIIKMGHILAMFIFWVTLALLF